MHKAHVLPRRRQVSTQEVGKKTNESINVTRRSYLYGYYYVAVCSRSFVWSTLGVTAMAFVTGALAFWTPTFMSRARVIQGKTSECSKEPCDPSDRYTHKATECSMRTNKTQNLIVT